MRLFYLMLTTSILLQACQSSSTSIPNQEVAPYESPEHHSASLNKVFEAHGGYERWNKMKSLSYVKDDESTITNLQNRKIKLESPERTIGFDGMNVWITPDTLETNRVRFYHNLYFYFYAMPFVVGDDGAYYEDVPQRELDGKTYSGIKVSYGEGIGDAPDDNYIIWYDSETYKMEWLMYTVTYTSGEPSDKYKLIKYSEWKEYNGLLLPTYIQWHQFDGEIVGDRRGEGTTFSEVKISEDYPAESLFQMPQGAAIAPR